MIRWLKNLFARNQARDQYQKDRKAAVPLIRHKRPLRMPLIPRIEGLQATYSRRAKQQARKFRHANKHLLESWPFRRRSPLQPSAFSP